MIPATDTPQTTSGSSQDGLGATSPVNRPGRPSQNSPGRPELKRKISTSRAEIELANANNTVSQFMGGRNYSWMSGTGGGGGGAGLGAGAHTFTPRNPLPQPKRSKTTPTPKRNSLSGISEATPPNALADTTNSRPAAEQINTPAVTQASRSLLTPTVPEVITIPDTQPDVQMVSPPPAPIQIDSNGVSQASPPPMEPMVIEADVLTDEPSPISAEPPSATSAVVNQMVSSLSLNPTVTTTAVSPLSNLNSAGNVTQITALAPTAPIAMAPVPRRNHPERPRILTRISEPNIAAITPPTSLSPSTSAAGNAEAMSRLSTQTASMPSPMPSPQIHDPNNIIDLVRLLDDGSVKIHRVNLLKPTVEDHNLLFEEVKDLAHTLGNPESKPGSHSNTKKRWEKLSTALSRIRAQMHTAAIPSPDQVLYDGTPQRPPTTNRTSNLVASMSSNSLPQSTTPLQPTVTLPPGTRVGAMTSRRPNAPTPINTSLSSQLHRSAQHTPVSATTPSTSMLPPRQIQHQSMTPQQFQSNTAHDQYGYCQAVQLRPQNTPPMGTFPTRISSLEAQVFSRTAARAQENGQRIAQQPQMGTFQPPGSSAPVARAPRQPPVNQAPQAPQFNPNIPQPNAIPTLTPTRVAMRQQAAPSQVLAPRPVAYTSHTVQSPGVLTTAYSPARTWAHAHLDTFNKFIQTTDPNQWNANDPLRFQLLESAFKQDDHIFVVLHQVFCTADHPARQGNPFSQDPRYTLGLELLSQLLFPNSSLSPRAHDIFVQIPCELSVAIRTIPGFEDSMTAALDLLSKLRAIFDTLYNYCVGNNMATPSSNLMASSGITSVSLQRTINVSLTQMLKTLRAEEQRNQAQQVQQVQQLQQIQPTQQNQQIQQLRTNSTSMNSIPQSLAQRLQEIQHSQAAREQQAHLQRLQMGLAAQRVGGAQGGLAQMRQAPPMPPERPEFSVFITDWGSKVPGWKVINDWKHLSPDLQRPTGDGSDYYTFFTRCVSPILKAAFLAPGSFTFDVDLSALCSKAQPKTDRREGACLNFRPISNGQKLYRLRCVSSKRALSNVGSSEDFSAWRTLETCWPPTFFAEINGQQLHFRRKKSWLKDWATDITDMLDPENPTIKLDFMLMDGPSDDGSSYFLAIEELEIANLPTLMERITKEQVIDAPDAKQLITTRLKNPASTKDDEISVVDDTVTVSIICPISQRLLETPVRGKHCKHLDCFDLESFLKSRTKFPDSGVAVPDAWKCPICNCECAPPTLVVDGFMKETVARVHSSPQFKENTKSVIIRADGMWRPNNASDASASSGGSKKIKQEKQHPIEIIEID